MPSVPKECNATCYKIDRTGQYFNTDHPAEHCKIIILAGYNRARVEVGDSGVMKYRTTKTSGLWYFYKKEADSGTVRTS